ncbi:glycosyl transferase family 2 [Burkholderia pseudomallei]|nr:glycosyl transferase family 2 [Burkholderia pseudomallei]
MGGTRVCDRFTPALPSPLQSPRALPAFNAFLPSPRYGRKGRLARLSSATSRR